jgi:hypothetical protein
MLMPDPPVSAWGFTSPTTACAACEAPIYPDQDHGWLDARSGDDGGSYDLCPGADELDGPHRPVRRAV